MPDRVRKSALLILNALDTRTITLDRLMDSDSPDEPDSDPRDRRLLNALVYGVLRWRGRLDWIVSRLSKTPLNKIDPPVLNILRLGIFQIEFMDRIPVSAAVNTSVELAKQTAPNWVVRYVNAVLRNAVRNRDRMTLPDATDASADAIAVVHSMPVWLVGRWLKRYGIETCRALCERVNRIPPLTLRANTLKARREDLVQALAGQADGVAATRYSPVGVRLDRPRQRVWELNGFSDGWFQVQDEAAQLISLLLAPRPGDRVLDACAGMGGKTGHLAQLMENKGSLTAVDRDWNRLAKLELEMERLGVTIATCEVSEIAGKDSELPQGPFDRILLDAPCSGLGVLGRNPDAKWSRRPEDLTAYADLQLSLLGFVSKLLKPNGILVYSVCSPEPEETHEVIASFLKNHPHFAINGHPGRFARQIGGLLDTRGYLQTYPHLLGMDGFFGVRLQRRSGSG